MYPQVRVVTHPVNRGYGGALRSGFASASKEIVFYTDGDAQYDPSEMALLWPMMTPGVDLVNGYKISRSDPLAPHHHRPPLSPHRETHVRPAQCATSIAISGMMRRSIFDRVRLEKNSGVICLEMMKKIQDAGFTDRRSPGAPLPSRPRQVAVLQFPAHLPHGRGRV